MSKQDNSEDNIEHTVEYVYIPDEGVYGTIVRYGAWSSLIEFYESGIKYTIEIANEDFHVVNEIGIGYLGEEDDSL